MRAILRNNPLHLIPAILLKHLKLPVSAIREAVLSCDHSILGEQHIRLMAAFAPDKREVRGVTISLFLLSMASLVHQ